MDDPNQSYHSAVYDIARNKAIGTSLAFGVIAAQDVTIRNACKTYYGTALTAEATKQATITNSRSKNLQNNGDIGPA